MLQAGRRALHRQYAEMILNKCANMIACACICVRGSVFVCGLLASILARLDHNFSAAFNAYNIFVALYVCHLVCTYVCVHLYMLVCE